MKALIALTSLALGGCASIPSETMHREMAWQALNLVDGVQTSQYQHNDCRETGAWRYITGPEPSVRDTAIAATLNGALHFSMTYLLDRFDAPSGLKKMWAYGTIGATGAQVGYNASLGCN